MFKLKNLISYNLSPVWSLEDSDQQLYNQLILNIKEIEYYSAFKKIVPAQEHIKFFDDGGILSRPENHWRSFYYDLAQHKKYLKGFLAFKGTESLSCNIKQIMRNMDHPYSIFSWSMNKSGAGLADDDIAFLPIFEKYLYIEQKLPGLYLFDEAQEEIAKAVCFQRRYYLRYQSVAKTPIPLYLYKVPENYCAKIIKAAKSIYDQQSYSIFASLIAKGIAITVYWYPSLPRRVAHIKACTGNDPKTFKKRHKALKTQFDVNNCINGWLELFSRMLMVGFIPADPRSAGKGYCIDPGNLTLDGGMVDLGSIRDIESFGFPGEIKYILDNNIRQLVESIYALLIGKSSLSRDYKKGLPNIHYLVFLCIKNMVTKELENNTHIPDYVLQYFVKNTSSLDIIQKIEEFIKL